MVDVADSSFLPADGMGIISTQAALVDLEDLADGADRPLAPRGRRLTVA